jgi:imidazoleglycerol-phosphate dehydratase
MNRVATLERRTSETSISVTVDLDGRGSAIDTGLPFFDHMLASFALNAGCRLDISGRGDLEVDDHHLVEDCALTIGAAVAEALGEKRGIRRTAHAYGVLDEALVRAVVDLSGRGYADVRLGFCREMLGGVATENLTHFFQSLAARLGAAIHVRALSAENDHHRAEAAFKAVGRALGDAMRRTESTDVPSTKGSLTC